MTAFPTGPGAAASADSTLEPPSLAPCKLVAGGRWQGYKLGKALPGAEAHAFEGTKLDVLELVWVIARPITEMTEWRRGAWQRLAELEDVATVGCLEAIEEEGWRYEVFRQPPGSTLADWFACHQAGYESVEALARQLGDVLRAMHAQGVVHLNLSPDAIHVDPSAGGLRIVVAGLSEATLYTQSEVRLAAVDPLYAPPEAAGRERHPPGTGLCAWDWWSVGRIIQQFVLGRHVVALLRPDAAKDRAALRAVGTGLLLERDPPGMRAGAIEAMGPQDPVIKTLLQGLLTSARDARWSDVDVRRWLARETVRVHYELPTRARLFVWKGRGYTLASASEHFAQEENWDDGETNLFAAEDPSTLAWFLKQDPGLAAEAACIDATADWLSLPGWASIPPAARRTVTAAVTWLALARRQGLKPGLVVRGRKTDAEGLTALLESGCPGEAVALAQALLEPGFLERLATVDAEAVADLYDLATTGGEALHRASQAGWIERTDEEAHIRVLCLALESEHTLAGRVEKLRANYVDNRDPELARLLADRGAPHWAEVVLAYTGERALRYGYITAVQARRERLAHLDRELLAVRAALFWRRLERFFRLTWLAGASRVELGALIAVLLGVGGILADRPVVALAAVFLVVAARLGASGAVCRMLRPSGLAASAWRVSDGAGRCAREASRLRPAERASIDLERERRELEAQRAALGAEPLPATLRARPLAPLWTVMGLAQLAIAACAVLLAREAWPRLDGRTAGPDVPAVAEAVPVSPGNEARERAVASGKFEYVDEGFGRRLRGPLEPWTLHAPAAAVAPLPVKERRAARPAQKAHALVSLELLLKPYARDAVNALVAVRVPSAAGGMELMILNGRNRRPVEDIALRLSEELVARTWYQYDRRRVVFLGEPAQLEGEISLAPP